MTGRRFAALAGLLVLVALPLLAPLLELLRLLDRLAHLAGNTLLLVGGTLALALPLGTAAAVLLFRTDLPLRRGLRSLTVLALFVPLPLLTSAWQAALGSGGWLAALWHDAPGRPWASGLGPAIWIHAIAALPWVVLIVGLGLTWVEGELEEDATLAAGRWRALWRVTLPRCRAALGAAALWVGLQTASEITVTDAMQVRTFAEEVYLEFWQGGADALARAAAVSLPAVAAVAVLLRWALPRLERALPPLPSLLTPPRPYPLGRARWSCLALVLAGLLLLVGVPLASLLWRAGLHGTPRTWSAEQVGERVLLVAETEGGTLAQSLLFALLAGGLTVAAALQLCWLSLDAAWFRGVLLWLTAVLWAVPGPVVGAGLKGLIQAFVEWSPQGPLAVALYYGPSPAPVLWANLLRFLPCAVAVLWPVVRLLPWELRDSTRVDGATPGQEFRHVVWPLTRRAALGAVLVVTALSLGEVGAAAMRVETPGWQTFAHVLFDRMHYGVQDVVAALCLLLLAAVVAAAGALAGLVLLVRLSRSLRGSRRGAARPALPAGHSAPPPR